MDRSRETFECFIKVFDPSGTLAHTWNFTDFKPTDSELTITRRFKGSNWTPNVAINPVTGHIVLCGYKTVSMFELDGTLVGTFGSCGVKDGQFISPCSVAFDAVGNIVLSDYRGVQLFSPDGQFKRRLWEGISQGVGGFNSSVDCYGRIIVCHYESYCISIWE